MATEPSGQGLPPELGSGLMADDSASALPPGLGSGLMAEDLARTEPASMAPATELSPWSSRGEVSLESRAFLPDDRESTQDLNVGLFARAGLEWGAAGWAFGARMYARSDSADQGRSLVVLEELWLQAGAEHVVARAGVDIFNWSATEAFHPADIINARNFDSDVERYEKIGEPFLSVEGRWPRGSVAAYYLPYVGRPFLPSRASRLNGLPEALSIAEFASLDAGGAPSSERFMHQGALRVRQTIGDADLSLHVVRHVDRSQPELLVNPADGTATPLMRTVTQVGGAYQQVIEPVIVKMELGYRFFVDPDDRFPELLTLPDRDHLQLALGVEYSWAWGGSESSLILEGQSIFFAEPWLRRQLHIFQRDVLIGYRLALDDPGATTFSLSAIADVEIFDELLVNASVERRLWKDWTISAVVRGVAGTRGASALVLPADSDHLRLSLTRYF